MELQRIDTPASQTDADVVVVGLYSDQPPQDAAAQINEASGEVLGRLIEAKEITGKRNETTWLHAAPGVAARSVLVVGLGSRNKFDRQGAHEACGTAAKATAGKQRQRVALHLAERWGADLVEAGVAGAVVGCQGQDLYRAEKKLYPPEAMLWAGGPPEALRSGQILGESANLTRRLINEPPDRIYPESFAAAAADVADACGLEAEIWDENRLADERCRALLAVGQGSSRPPRLVMLRHNGGDRAGKGGPLLAVVGKGVTFDSGGLSIKPSEGMLTMKGDMAGAATMLGTMQAIARLELPVNVIGLAGLVENMISGAAYKLGDVLTARNGRTIEVQNTDAEGRVVLADVLSVAVDLGAERIVDLATLTGACVVALGNDVAGAMTNDQAWCDRVLAAAAACGEPLWQLPMFDLYAEQIKSNVADIKNIGDGRWGGAITAAKFLEEFVACRPWVHLDIAGPAFRDKPKSHCDGGGSGIFVRTLVELVRGMA